MLTDSRVKTNAKVKLSPLLFHICHLPGPAFIRAWVTVIAWKYNIDV